MPDHATRRHDTPWRHAWQRFAAHRATVHGLGLLAVLVIAGLFEPVMNGRYRGDPLLRTLGAAPESLGFALLAGGAGALAGLAWGTLAATLGGRAGRAVTALARGAALLPLALLPMLAGAMAGQGLGLLALAVAAAVAPPVAVAAQRAALGVARLEHLTAAEASGVTPGRLLLRHHLPVLAGPYLLAAWPALPHALAAESVASLLGLGIAPGGGATWGTLLGDATSAVRLAAPALALAVALAALHAIGQGVRRAVHGTAGRLP